ncbi:hypothetical protein RND81_06G024200 [Saponaria officinalis]|uniref:Auxin efflux carrier n=1 Tax=Saponaria officinalis TaxID=3572 RepID=A0AAW1K8V3_SAPOF
MRILDLFVVASMPITEVLLITALGLYLALENVDIVGDSARKHMNKVVFFVFNPALVGSNLAKTVWFMPVNVLISFLLGSALGWVVVRVTKPPKHLKGLSIGSSSAGNIGNKLIIIITAICKEKGSPFGAPDACHTYGMAYSLLSLAFVIKCHLFPNCQLGAIFLWSYVYNVVRISTRDGTETAARDEFNGEASVREPLLPSSDCSPMHSVDEMRISSWIKDRLISTLSKINLPALLAPSTIGAIVGFVIGVIGPTWKLLISNDAPFHVIEDSAYLLGEAAIPTTTLILGANLLQGLKGSAIQLRIVFGIEAVRFIFVPLLGIFIVKGAVHLGILKFDPLFQFVLLLQYAIPPAMNIGPKKQELFS